VEVTGCLVSCDWSSGLENFIFPKGEEKGDLYLTPFCCQSLKFSSNWKQGENQLPHLSLQHLKILELQSVAAGGCVRLKGFAAERKLTEHFSAHFLL